VDQGYGDQKKTEWVNIVAWEKLADLSEKYLKKGKTIALSGTLQTRSWDKEGVKQYRTEVVARDITFLDGGSKSEDRPTRQERATPTPRQQAAPEPRATAPINEDPFGDNEPFWGRMNIQVTEKHIRQGVRGSCSRDPISLAMKDAGLSSPWASPDHLQFRVRFKDYSVDTPESVLYFMQMFDNGGYVMPFEFELEGVWWLDTK
jgi:single stranded DNA-binding protein